MRLSSNNLVLAPAAPQNFFQNETAAEIGEAEGDKAPQVQVNSALPTPARELPTGNDSTEHQQSEKGQGGLVR